MCRDARAADHKHKEMMYKILIVEDDKTIANAVKKHVETWGVQAYATQNFQNVMEDFAAARAAAGDSGCHVAVL